MRLEKIKKQNETKQNKAKQREKLTGYQQYRYRKQRQGV
jgi:hypothetical protein